MNRSLPWTPPSIVFFLFFSDLFRRWIFLGSYHFPKNKDRDFTQNTAKNLGITVKTENFTVSHPQGSQEATFSLRQRSFLDCFQFDEQIPISIKLDILLMAEILHQLIWQFIQLYTDFTGFHTCQVVLDFCHQQHYSLENQHGTRNAPLWKGKSSSKPWIFWIPEVFPQKPWGWIPMQNAFVESTQSYAKTTSGLKQKKRCLVVDFAVSMGK